MLIKALCDYHEILSKQNKLVGDEYSMVGINYLIALSETGEIFGLIDNHYENTSGKKPKLLPKPTKLPRRVETTKVLANIVEHRPLYIFGLNYDGENDVFSTLDKTNKAANSLKDFKEKNLEFIENIDSPVVNAYREFILNYDPNDDVVCSHLQPIKKDYEKLKFAFCLYDASTLLHHDEQLKSRWEQLCSDNLSEQKGEISICAVSGNKSTIARVHDKIKGFNAMGSVLIGVKEDAMCSYGNAQGYNASISQEVMSKYTTSLNYLLSEKRHKVMLDDITVIHFALSDNDIYDDVFNDFFDVSDTLDRKDTEDVISKLFENAKQAAIKKEHMEFDNIIDPNVTYYTIGLKPNSSRIAIKFLYKQKFGHILENIAKHQADLATEPNSKPIALWQLQKELKSPVSSSDNIDPSLASKLMQSILYGYQYPKYLLSTVIRRIKTDSNSDKNQHVKINPRRIAIIKAFLNRSSRLENKKEEITMALNLENKDPAYLCGRLFSVLEDLQVDASGGGLNKTIKDAYFSSACTKPATIFPKLLKLASFHLPKAKFKSNRDYEIREIIGMLNDEFPELLTLKDQGKFIIGYYQQSQNKYQKNKDKNMEEK